MSGKDGYGRSSLSFNAPKGILDVDDIMESNPWKDMKTFDHAEAGQIQRVLNEFGDMLSQQKQKSGGAVRKNEPRKKVAARTKEPGKLKGSPAGVERKSGKVGGDAGQKIGKVEAKPKQVETRRTPIARKSKSTPKRNEESVPVKKPRKDLDNAGNEEKPVAEKKIVTRRSLTTVQKVINTTKLKKSDDVKTADEQAEPKANVDNAAKKKPKVEDADVKKTVKRQRKTSEKTVTGKTATKIERKDTKNRTGIVGGKERTRAEVDKENKKPSAKKLETSAAARGRKSVEGNRKTTQRDKPPSAVRSSFGKNRITSKSSSEVKTCGQGSAGKSTESIGPENSLEAELEKLRRSTENAKESATNHENSAESFYLIAEETRVIAEETPKPKPTAKNRAEAEKPRNSRHTASFNKSANAAEHELSKCASSTLLYDSAISSCSHQNRKSRISIVAKVQSDLDESLPPLELKCKVDMMKCKKGGKLRPKITMKTPKNTLGASKDASRKDQPMPQKKKMPEKPRKQCSKGKPRKSYQQRLEDREERREMRRAKKHKRKAALAIEEFSRHVVKMAKKMGYLNGDSGSAASSSSSAATTSSTSSASFGTRGICDFSDSSSDDTGSSYTSSFTSTSSSSDTSYCSCTSCLLSDSYESSGDFTEFSPCSTTSGSSGSTGSSSGSSTSSTTGDSETDEA